MIKTISREQLRQVRKRLERLYGKEAEKHLERFVMIIGRYGVGVDVTRRSTDGMSAIAS